MKTLFLAALIFAVLQPHKVHAQQAIVPCIQTVTPNGGKTCSPVTIANPLPVTQTK